MTNERIVMKRIVFLLGISLCMIGCASTDVYKEVFKDDAPSYNSKEFDVYPRELYLVVQKIVCSRNFIIDQEDESSGVFLAKRYFQKGKRRMILTLQSKIIPGGGDTSFLYLNAMQTTERIYVSDRTRFFLWLIPLPGGGGKQSTEVKEGEKIVEDKKFYADFFAAIEAELGELAEAKRILALEEAEEAAEAMAGGSDAGEIEDVEVAEESDFAGEEVVETMDAEENIVDQEELTVGVTIDKAAEEVVDVQPSAEAGQAGEAAEGVIVEAGETEAQLEEMP